MSWFSDKIKSLGRSAATGLSDYYGGLSIFRLPVAGVAVSERSALNYSGVWRCVKAITDPIMLMPFRVHKTTNGKREILSSHPVDWLLHRQANPEMSASIFKETLTAHALTWGNGYAEIETNRAGQVIALWPITPDRVEPMRDESGKLYYEIRQPDGRAIELPPERMFHLKGLGFDGIRGYSVIALAKEAISMGLATESFGAAFFGNGAILGTVISAPQGVELSKDAITNIKKTFDKKHKGAKRAHGTEVLDQGMKAEMIGVPPEQAQFLETRKFQLAEIARWFGVPLHKLMSDSGMTFKNVEQLDIIFVNDTLMPWNKRWEEEVDIKLLGRDNPDLHAKMNTKGLLRGDIDTRKEWYKSMFNLGVYSINEIRAYEDEDPIGPEGDIRMVPLNMATLAEAYRNGTTGNKKSLSDESSPAQMREAAAPVYVDSVVRLARKESRALATLAKKASDLETFGARATEFYQEHEAQLFEAIQPAIKLVATLSGQPVETFITAMKSEVSSYCHESYHQALEAFEQDAFERFTATLEPEAHDRAIAFLEKQLTSTRQAA